MYIKTGDTVYIKTGKDRGKTGKVLEAFPRKNLVLVEGVNKQTKHQKKRSQRAKSQIVEREAPMNVSNVALLDPKTKKPTRVRFSVKNGKKVRVATKSGSEI